MGLGTYVDQLSWNREHPAIKETLDQVFDDRYPATLVQQELNEQITEIPVEVETYEDLPDTPYEYDKTPTVARKWEVMVAEYMLCEESLPEKRYQQSAARATEHLNCSAAESVKSALTRETFFKPFKIRPEELDEPINISAPSAELVRDVLDEAERLLRQQPDIIEQIKEQHGS